MLLRYLIPSDQKFYTNYAVPLISSCPERFALDGFRARLSKDTRAAVRQLSDFETAFSQFQEDTDAQYEMHPRFGRYVWDVADQWYQKWQVIFSIDHMWNWAHITEHDGDNDEENDDGEDEGDVEAAGRRPFQPATIEPWLDHISQRYNIHPNHRQLLERIYGQLVQLNQTNRPLALVGASSLNTMPFFPPSWFADKEPQRHGGANEGLASSFVARFVPPYRLTHVPERWDRVFLKGLTVMDLTRQFTVEPSYIFSTIPIHGLTLHFDPSTGCSHLVLVMKKASHGSLEESLEHDIPTNYDKPRALALSVTKRIKDLHWEFVHGNIHPRNILLNLADTLGDLSDITFMQRNSHSEHYRHRGGGRWPYIAPELANHNMSSAADIYALGIILWQLVSRITFPDNALIDPHVYRIEPIPGIMKEWEDLIADCLQSDPGKRPNAYTVYRRLEKIPEHINLDPAVLDYIHHRRNEAKAYLEGHRLSEMASTTAEVGDRVWTASVTRWVNHSLDKYPNLVQRFEVV
ncbi:kinase-like domain-containing protein [Zychaea mexicana]|uniref:kinase-like domain-containing protein n=1 Tax=Zychaea mexicana TaxID=64656 RepID=UPI0022FF3DBC|nr:kinase-like domain-containing protein [Zychaea mexicana]KAI9496945.1 kinase-like domain-containing protein [Zychaea mexicana]